VYDYLWVGETVDSIDSLRTAVKNHPPYVVRCLDFSRATIPKEDEMYLQSIPYMQFPLLLGGRPVTGERAVIPGIHYADDGKDFWIMRPRGTTQSPVAAVTIAAPQSCKLRVHGIMDY
jgi:hypothetical protein